MNDKTRESLIFGVALEMLAVLVFAINSILAAAIIRFHRLKTDCSFILMFNIALSRSIGLLNVVFHTGPEILFPTLFESFDSHTFIEAATAFVFALCWYATLISKVLISMHTFHKRNRFLPHLFTRSNMIKVMVLSWMVAFLLAVLPLISGVCPATLDIHYIDCSNNENYMKVFTLSAHGLVIVLMSYFYLLTLLSLLKKNKVGIQTRKIDSEKTGKTKHILVQISLAMTTFVSLTAAQLWVEFSNHSLIALAVLKLLFCLDFFINAACFIWINDNLVSQMKRTALCQKVPKTITTMFAVALFMSNTTKRISHVPELESEPEPKTERKHRNMAKRASDSDL